MLSTGNKSISGVLLTGLNGSLANGLNLLIMQSFLYLHQNCTSESLCNSLIFLEKSETRTFVQFLYAATRVGQTMLSSLSFKFRNKLARFAQVSSVVSESITKLSRLYIDKSTIDRNFPIFFDNGFH